MSVDNAGKQANILEETRQLEREIFKPVLIYYTNVTKDDRPEANVVNLLLKEQHRKSVEHSEIAG